jgi:crotonobetainyl-CoA:carnitine CoA-transferase CaiB-like acyl-CoA transferase
VSDEPPLRVVEIARDVAGSVCGRLFAALGHDVVKCEAKGGDPARHQPPLNSGGTGLSFVALNADKQSVTADSADDIAALLDGADVLILDLTPAAAAALDLSPERLRASWPRLVVSWITAFGRDGDYSELRGDSMLAESYGGIATMIGEAERPPLSLGGEQAAYCAGVTGFLGALLALRRRDAGSDGDIVDVAMCDVAAYMDWKSDVAYFMTGSAPARGTAKDDEWRMVRASDGWVGFIFQQRHWPAVVELVGAPELRDPELAEEAARMTAGPRWWPAVERWAAALPAEEIYNRAQRLGLPFGWAVTAAGLLRSAQLRERGFVAPAGAGAAAQAGLLPAVGSPAPGDALPWRSGRTPEPGSASLPGWAEPAAAAPAGNEPSADTGFATPPLSGVVVLDFGTITAGAAVTRLLADHGATVLKIEWADRPDRFRSWKMPDGDTRLSPYFASNNVGKLGVAVNLKHAAGRDLVKRLATRAHVLVENYRVGVTQRLGIDDATLRAVNPDLIYLSLSSQGQQGPESRNSSFGSTLDLLSGLASLTGYDGDRPMWSSGEVNYPDQLVSLVGAAFVVYCLRMRLAGVNLDISQREVVSWTLAAEVADYLVSGHDSAPRGNRRPGRTPHDIYPTAERDRWVALSCVTDAERSALAACLAADVPADLPADLLADLPADELTGKDEGWWEEHREDVSGLIAAWTARRSRDECVALLRTAGVPAVPVLNAADRAATPRFRERLVSFPTGGAPVKGFPVLFGDYAAPVHLTAPAIGADTHAVLTRLGVPAGELSRLEEQGVISCAP